MDREKNIPAIFVTPAGMGARKRPAVIFLHSATGHRESFLGEAMSLAENENVVSLLPEAPYGRPEWRLPRGLRDVEKELEMWRSAARELSAWTDFLLTRSEVDPEMIFFVGKNLGGGVGGFWLTSEKRVRGAVFSGSIPDQSIFWTESSHPVAVKARRGVPRSNLAAFRKVMSDTDLIAVFPRLRDVTVRFQFGRQDEWLSRKAVDGIFGLARDPHSAVWLDDGHDMSSVAAIDDRRKWILDSIGVKNDHF